MPFSLPMIILIQVALLAAAIILMLGYRFDMLPFKVAFLGFALSLLCVFVVGIIVVGLSFFGKASLTGGYKVLALLIAFAPVTAVMLSVGKKGLSVPPIHNITTNIASPPAFNEAYMRRSASENSLDILTGDEQLQHEKHYQNLKPLTTSLEAQAAYQRALKVAKQLGWVIYHEAPKKLYFEAYEQTALFGFKDDVVVRILSTQAGSQVDLRSVSRVGKSDLGANAARIKKFIATFESSQ